MCGLLAYCFGGLTAHPNAAEGEVIPYHHTFSQAQERQRSPRKNSQDLIDIHGVTSHLQPTHTHAATPCTIPSLTTDPRRLQLLLAPSSPVHPYVILISS